MRIHQKKIIFGIVFMMLLLNKAVYADIPQPSAWSNLFNKKKNTANLFNILVEEKKQKEIKDTKQTNPKVGQVLNQTSLPKIQKERKSLTYLYLLVALYRSNRKLVTKNRSMETRKIQNIRPN